MEMRNKTRTNERGRTERGRRAKRTRTRTRMLNNKFKGLSFTFSNLFLHLVVPKQLEIRKTWKCGEQEDEGDNPSLCISRASKMKLGG